jgi:hypothetical protein
MQQNHVKKINIVLVKKRLVSLENFGHKHGHRFFLPIKFYLHLGPSFDSAKTVVRIRFFWLLCCRVLVTLRLRRPIRNKINMDAEL